MLVKRLLGIGMALSWVGCSPSNAGNQSADGNAQTDTGAGGTTAPSTASNADSNSGKGGGSSSSSGKDTTSNSDSGKGGASNSDSSKGGGSSSNSDNGGSSSDSGTSTNSTETGTCAFTCQASCRSLGGTVKDGACPEEGQKCCDMGSAGGAGGSTSGGGNAGGAGGSTSGGQNPGGNSSSATGGATDSGTDTNTGPCQYECTDFCLNAGGVKMSGSCGKAGYVCCNVEAAETTATGTQYYIDSKSGNDSNDGTSEDKAWKSVTKIKSAGSSAVVNLKRGGVWETTGAINVTNMTIRPYGKGPRPVVNGTKIIVPQSLGTIVLKGKSVLDGVKVTSDQGFGAYINGNDNIIRNVEVDGTGTGALMGIGIVGNNNEVTNCYVHDLTVNTGDTGDVNSSGGAEGIVAFAGSHINVGHNTVARAHCANKTLGGDEGGCTEIIMNPLFFSTYGKTMEDIQFHHNLCVDTVGLFESCQGTGEVGFDPTKDPGTIKDVTVAYNVVLDSKWMYLAQIVNTIHKNVVFEHNTIIHGPRNDKQWSTDAMSHEYMFGMMFSSSNGTSVSTSLTAAEIIIRNNMFWEPFTKEDVLIGVTSGHNNNLFGPSTLNLEKRWTLDSTEKKVDDLGLVDVFHPTADSPAVDKGSDKSLFDKDFYGNATCGSAPDIGAVEYCEDSAVRAKSDEIAKYLELNK